MFDQILEGIRNIHKSDGFIPLSVPQFEGKEKELLINCIDSSYVSSVGEYVDAFEKSLCDFTKAKHAVVTSNGTSALHISLIVAGVEPGDEVITQALTFVATSNAIRYCGADPIYIDVSRQRASLCPEALESFFNQRTSIQNNICINKFSGKKIKACVPMHTFGHPADLDGILKVCKKFNVTVIEDAAESLGSTYKGRHTGTLGEMGILSFNGNKIITTGGGGAILTNSDSLAKKLKHLTTTAKVSHDWNFDHDELGYNYRMPNLNAALGVAQIENLDNILLRKRSLSEKYKSYFKSINVSFFEGSNDSLSNCWLNSILLDNEFERDRFLKESNSNGVMTRPVWKLNNTLKMYQHCYSDNLSNSIWLSNRLVNIPSSPLPRDLNE